MISQETRGLRLILPVKVGGLLLGGHPLKTIPASKMMTKEYNRAAVLEFL